MTTQQMIDEINRIKKEENICILAHTYQPPEIIDLADITGDSFLLSKKAAEIPCQKVIMCGVKFMAETVKILSPQKQVILAAPDAACAMARQIDPKRVADYKAEHPDTAVVAYINTTAAFKAECDVCVTSSSALKIVGKLEEKDILFLPDRNLGSFVAENFPEKNITLWEGHCPVHAQLTPDDILAVKSKHPNVPVAMHPECTPEVLALADMKGSTSDIIKFALEQEGDVIIVTERGVSEYLNLKNPNRNFIQPCPEKLTCPDMKMTTVETLYKAITGQGGQEIEIDEELRIRAKQPIDKMLEYGG